MKQGYVMFKRYLPHYLYDSVSEVDYASLRESGIKALIFDIDNTLVSYKTLSAPPGVTRFLRKLRSDGFSVGFVSNNKHERVDVFTKGLGGEFYSHAKARKPSAKAIRKVIHAMGVTPSETALIGDQFFTDVIAARRAGLTAILVNPIESSETLFFKFKRMAERPFLYKIRKKRKGDSGNS
ncbi:hypothetical protein FACS1894105_08920 [Clostridia bacterium]|nr:hypothetical protein FACS1894105_08920 [Clostridia bacterium]